MNAKRVRDMKDGKEVHKQRRVMEYEEKYMSENLQRLEELQANFKDQMESVKRELANRQRDSELTFTELRKRNLLSSGYTREGANVKPRRKTLLEQGGKKKQ